MGALALAADSKANDSGLLGPEYGEWLASLKTRLRQAQLKAAVSVNQELLRFYWELGCDIVERQKSAAWGDGFLKQLSADLMTEFPEMKGFSYRNIRYIRQWRVFYGSDSANWQQAVAKLVQIPWGHNLAIIGKCKSVEEARYYVDATVEHGWSRSVLTHQIESGLWQRKGQALSNFESTLPAAQSELAQQVLKDPYVFDFLALTEDYKERELELGLLEHLTSFLLELGAGFAFVGRQVALQVGERDFFLDLLFYHTRLHCYVVVELKTTDFEPEHAGKLNFYLKAVDEKMRSDKDGKSIGILLCKGRDKTVVEYALSDVNKPIGVSEYQLTRALPEELRSSLPSLEEIEAEFAESKEGEA